MGRHFNARRRENIEKQEAKAAQYLHAVKEGNPTVIAFFGSDGEVTKGYYKALCEIGPAGLVAMNLFRAQKCSDRAKVYRGGVRGQGSYSRMAYDKKNWSISQLTQILSQHGAKLGIEYGWRQDTARDVHNWVLYIDLPTGQASFHSGGKGAGPDYFKPWRPNPSSLDVILAFCDAVWNGLPLAEMTLATQAPERDEIVELDLAFDRAIGE